MSQPRTEDQRIVEEEASAFAYALLIPQDALKRELLRFYPDGRIDPCNDDLLNVAAELAYLFHVGANMIIRRMAQLGWLDYYRPKAQVVSIQGGKQ